jgi:hypothetical protein
MKTTFIVPIYKGGEQVEEAVYTYATGIPLLRSGDSVRFDLLKHAYRVIEHEYNITSDEQVIHMPAINLEKFGPEYKSISREMLNDIYGIPFAITPR